MADIDVSVGLNTKDALDGSTKLITSLNDVVDVLEKVQKKAKNTDLSLSKGETKPDKAADDLARSLRELTKAYNPLRIAAEKLVENQSKVAELQNSGALSGNKLKQILAGLADTEAKLSDKIRMSSDAHKDAVKVKGLAAQAAKDLEEQEKKSSKAALESAKSFKVLGSRLEKHREAMRKAEKANEALIESSNKLGMAQVKLAKEMDAKRLGKLIQAQNRIRKHRLDMVKATKKLIEQEKNLRISQEKLGQSLSDGILKKQAAAQRKLAQALRETAAASKKAAAAQERLKNNQAGIANGLRGNINLWGALKSAVGAYIGLNVASSMVDTISAFDSMNASLGIVSGSSRRAAKDFEFVSNTALRLGLSVTRSGKEFVKLTAAAKGTKVEGKGVRDIFTGISEASRALNLSADDVSGAFRAIVQIMSKGTVNKGNTLQAA